MLLSSFNYHEAYSFIPTPASFSESQCQVSSCYRAGSQTGYIFFFLNLEQKGYMEKRVEFCLYLCPDFILPLSFETISNSKAFTQLSKIPKTARLSGAGMNFRQNKLVEHWCKCVITMIQAVVKSQDVLALSRAWHSMRLWLREWSRKLLSPRV